MSRHLIQRGLALQIGERNFEVDRLLEKSSVVQLEDVATGARKTYRVANLQRDVSAGRVKILGDSGAESESALQGQLSETLPYLLSKLSEDQERILDRKRAYVLAARRRGPGELSASELIDVIRATAERLEERHPPSPTTVYRWLAAYEKGDGNIASLIPRTAFRRSPTRIAEWVASVAWTCMRTHYFRRNGRTLRETYEIYLGAHQAHLKKRGPDAEDVSPMSWTSFWRLCKTVPAYERDRARKGGTYAAHRWRRSTGGVYATRPLERVEMDHTMLDVHVIDDDRHVPLGRPMLTMIIDSFSNYILAIYISFEGETLGRVAKAIRMALTLKDDVVAGIDLKNEWVTPGMWECLVVDNALAFQSPQLKRIANVLGCDLEFGPVRRPWFKPTVERYMLEFTRLLPAEGRTQKPGEAKDPSDPSKTACITFSALSSIIIKWAVDVHPFEIPDRTLVRPIDRLKEGLVVDPAPVLVPNLDELRFLTALQKSTSVGPGGVEFLRLPYRSVELGEIADRQPHPSFKTLMRYDPGDLGAIWVQDPVSRGWIAVPCLHSKYAQGLSVLQHRYLRSEARSKHQSSGAIEYLLQAKAELRDQISKSIKEGKKFRRERRHLAALGGVNSDRKVELLEPSATAPVGVAENSPQLLDQEIPTFEVVDPNAQKWWE
ncbi:hypothetical protein [Achromobacter sp. KK8]|jgi:putative transposase